MDYLILVATLLLVGVLGIPYIFWLIIGNERSSCEEYEECEKVVSTTAITRL